MACVLPFCLASLKTQILATMTTLSFSLSSCACAGTTYPVAMSKTATTVAMLHEILISHLFL